MRHYINLLETVDEFSTKGHADLDVRNNDPRFADNPMESPEEIDEFDASGGTGSLDRLHDLFRDAEISDQELAQGIQLTDGGLHKAAAALGTSPDRIKMLLASLTQQLRDDGESDVAESYHRFVEEDDREDPFADAADPDHASAESDYLGDLTVRSSGTGREKFIQGSQAAAIKKKLDGVGDDERKKDAILKPLLNEYDDESEPLTHGFADEINSDSGSYNFPWKFDGRSGFGTMQYSIAAGQPRMRLVSIRDSNGDDVDVNTQMRGDILRQARAFIPDA